MARLLAGLAGLSVLVASASSGAASDAPGGPPPSVAAAVHGLNPEVLALALRATRCAAAGGRVTAPPTLTVIDYSRPSVDERLWVFDLQKGELLYKELVAHGARSGGNLPTRFSNEPDSHQSSLGLFVTDEAYVGRNGYSLRLDGLDRGFNDRARERAIVMHGAPYVDGRAAAALGRLGRSHGCPALRDGIARELIDRIKGGSVVFAYYPDTAWLTRSSLLGPCGPTHATAAARDLGAAFAL